MPIVTLSGQQVNISTEQKAVLDTLDSCANGRFATVHGYVSGTSNKKCITPERSNINFISKFSYLKRNAKLLQSVQTVTLADMDLSNPTLAKLDAAKLQTTFDKAHAEVAASYAKTDSGDKSDGHRQGHERCYLQSSMGVKVHLVTEDGEVDGRKVKVPVKDADNGLPIVDSIMVSVLQIHKKVLEKGEYAPTKSQAKTILKRQIERKAEAVTLPFKVLSLKVDNFDSLTLDDEAVTPEDLEKVQAVLPPKYQIVHTD